MHPTIEKALRQDTHGRVRGPSFGRVQAIFALAQARCVVHLLQDAGLQSTPQVGCLSSRCVCRLLQIHGVRLPVCVPRCRLMRFGLLCQ